MHTRTRQRQGKQIVRRMEFIGNSFPNRRRSVRTIRAVAVPVPLHKLAVAGANDERWFEEATPDEAMNAMLNPALVSMREQHPDWYRVMLEASLRNAYGDMEP
jgi:hypothetical protein